MKYIILFLISFNVMADKWHSDRVVNNYFTTEINHYDTDVSKAIALSLANSHPFDFDTDKLQGSINGATYDGETAVSFALAKRLKKTILIHTSYGQNNGKDAVTLGGVFRFK